MHLFFHALGYVSVHSTDEACHAINAYEMAKSGDYVVWTLKGNVDYYNSKPPLLLWLMTISYKILGYTPLAMRLPSAISGLIILVLGVTYCYKKWGSKEALLFAAFLPACTIMFNFHMFRTGDMDSLYTLWFALTMFFMSRAEKRPVSSMVLVGAVTHLVQICTINKNENDNKNDRNSFIKILGSIIENNKEVVLMIIWLGVVIGGYDGDSRNRQLVNALQGMKAEFPKKEWYGRAIYMEDPLNDYKPQNSWELDAVFYA